MNFKQFFHEEFGLDKIFDLGLTHDLGEDTSRDSGGNLPPRVKLNQPAFISTKTQATPVFIDEPYMPTFISRSSVTKPKKEKKIQYSVIEHDTIRPGPPAKQSPAVQYKTKRPVFVENYKNVYQSTPKISPTFTAKKSPPIQYVQPKPVIPRNLAAAPSPVIIPPTPTKSTATPRNIEQPVITNVPLPISVPRPSNYNGNPFVTKNTIPTTQPPPFTVQPEVSGNPFRRPNATFEVQRSLFRTPHEPVPMIQETRSTTVLRPRDPFSVKSRMLEIGSGLNNMIVPTIPSSKAIVPVSPKYTPHRYVATSVGNLPSGSAAAKRLLTMANEEQRPTQKLKPSIPDRFRSSVLESSIPQKLIEGPPKLTRSKSFTSTTKNWMSLPELQDTSGLDAIRKANEDAEKAARREQRLSITSPRKEKTKPPITIGPITPIKKKRTAPEPPLTIPKSSSVRTPTAKLQTGRGRRQTLSNEEQMRQVASYVNYRSKQAKYKRTRSTGPSSKSKRKFKFE